MGALLTTGQLEPDGPAPPARALRQRSGSVSANYSDASPRSPPRESRRTRKSASDNESESSQTSSKSTELSETKAQMSNKRQGLNIVTSQQRSKIAKLRDNSADQKKGNSVNISPSS